MHEIGRGKKMTASFQVVLRLFTQTVLLHIGNMIAVLSLLDYRSLKLAERSLSVIRLMSNLERHRKVMKIISVPALHPIMVRHPKISVKYLKSDYLCSGLTTSQRAEAFCHHYQFACDHLEKTTLQKVLFDELQVWRSATTEYTHTMSLLLSESFEQELPEGTYRINGEGELSIHYKLNSILIYILSFTFVRGSTFGEKDETVVFVTRIQGIGGSFCTVRSATKSLNDISPPFALMAALEGLARALRIKKLVGVSSFRKKSSSRQSRGSDFGVYDRLFTALGATQFSKLGAKSGLPYADYFQLLLPIPEKPITEIGRNHRSRTNAKRKIRSQISNTVHDVLGGTTLDNA